MRSLSLYMLIQKNGHRSQNSQDTLNKSLLSKSKF